MSLTTYKAKRDFKKTNEPKPTRATTTHERKFVIQKHFARRLHYDFRLELNGVLKSWAVPKGPSTDPEIKRLAVEVEDHPLSYGKFEGTIPKGQYGAGRVEIWDKGTWKPLGSPRNDIKKGNLKFELHGQKLNGEWVLVRAKGMGKKNNWLLIKHGTHQDLKKKTKTLKSQVRN